MLTTLTVVLIIVAYTESLCCTSIISIFFFILWPHLHTWKFQGQGSNRRPGCKPIPRLWQHWIRSASTLQQCWSLNPLRKARDHTHTLTGTILGPQLAEPREKLLYLIHFMSIIFNLKNCMLSTRNPLKTERYKYVNEKERKRFCRK